MEPIRLTIPDIDLPFLLRTDASKVALGACLMHEINGVRHPIQYASRKLTKAEKNYPIVELECLAVVWAIQRFERFLLGKHFTVETDHQPLLALTKKKLNSSKLQRWVLLLQNYNFDIKYIEGTNNLLADLLSRNILEE